jgi:hypothetical protein
MIFFARHHRSRCALLGNRASKKFGENATKKNFRERRISHQAAQSSRSRRFQNESKAKTDALMHNDARVAGTLRDFGTDVV